MRVPKWLNRNVTGLTITSFCADVGYEMVTAVLPGFLNTIGVAAAALGWIEGAADALASFVKLGAGWYSDRIGHRKGIVAFGYFLSGTALALFALAVSWPLVLAGRMIAWFGKGIRGPLRDAMLAESVDAETRGRAFGLHRAGDTMGAVLGPLIGVALLGMLPAPMPDAPFRGVFLFSLVPGIVAVASILILVRETRRPPDRHLRLWISVRNLPKPYLRFLTGVGLFGAGDFSHTLLVLGAAQLLEPHLGMVRAAQAGALLYVVRNGLYAAASFPVGLVADRMDKQRLLAAGYVAGALTSFAVAVVFAWNISGPVWLALLFGAAGVYIAMEDALEGAIPADLVPLESRGTAYGLMGSVNGVGDLVASVLVGTLWTAVSPAAGFIAAGILMASGAVLVLWNRSRL
ncbi:MAG TPA: MFS transporter [Bryobacteraceae bacterium]|nr:MFS transporter [Bryobacteraceae bacterium]